MSKEQRYVLTIVTPDDEEVPEPTDIERMVTAVRAVCNKAYIRTDDVFIEPYEGYPHPPTEETPAAP